MTHEPTLLLRRRLQIVGVAAAVTSLICYAAAERPAHEVRAEQPAEQAAEASESEHTPEELARSREAFLAAYKVLMHPRCMNCHPAGDRPLQGEDSHVHLQNVQRGVDGRGKFALKCANCHQDANAPGVHTPPGNPNWHLPPEDMPMVFEGRTPAQLARQLKDPKQNGGKTLAQILLHVTEDKLVLAGWNPGEGRALPPLTHEEFAKQMRVWIENGAAEPE